MKVTRIIYPVGQGAFYSEHFELNDGTVINVVYDCGAKADWNDALERETELFLGEHEKEGIDALFISHFDEDHVNGIIELASECKIKKVILPVFREEEWLAITEFGILYHRNYQRLLDLFTQKHIQLVFVNPMGGDNQSLDNFYSLDRLPSQINSGTTICLWLDKIQWVYVPIYYDSLLKIKDEIKDEIELIPYNGRNLTIEDFKHIENFSNRLLQQVNNAYKRIVGDNNRPSMPCYSGPVSDNYTALVDINQSFPYRREYDSNRNKLYLSSKPLRGEWRAGCLYTGDSTLKKNQCIELSKYLKDRFIEQIDTLQVPHHGSMYNMSVSSVEKYLGLSFEELLCFASFGYGNRYKHPSTSCVKSITDELGEFFGVTECSNSILIEEFELSNN